MAVLKLDWCNGHFCIEELITGYGNPVAGFSMHREASEKSLTKCIAKMWVVFW